MWQGLVVCKCREKLSSSHWGALSEPDGSSWSLLIPDSSCISGKEGGLWNLFVTWASEDQERQNFCSSLLFAIGFLVSRAGQSSQLPVKCHSQPALAPPSYSLIDISVTTAARVQMVIISSAAGSILYLKHKDKDEHIHVLFAGEFHQTAISVTSRKTHPLLNAMIMCINFITAWYSKYICKLTMTLKIPTLLCTKVWDCRAESCLRHQDCCPQCRVIFGGEQREVKSWGEQCHCNVAVWKWYLSLLGLAQGLLHHSLWWDCCAMQRAYGSHPQAIHS